MTDRETYLKNLKKELDKYSKQLSIIQKEFKGTTGEHIEKITQSLQDILQEAVTTYEKLESASAAEWEPIKIITNEAFNNLKLSFHEKINTSTNQMRGYAEQIEENYQEHLACVAKYVKKHPFKSLVFAVGAGFFLGKILK